MNCIGSGIKIVEWSGGLPGSACFLCISERSALQDMTVKVLKVTLMSTTVVRVRRDDRIKKKHN